MAPAILFNWWFQAMESVNSSQPFALVFIAPKAPPNTTVDDQFLGGIAREDISKTTRASIACLSCKKHRTKVNSSISLPDLSIMFFLHKAITCPDNIQCSTENPCSKCTTSGRQCVYDYCADRRRKADFAWTEQEFRREIDKNLQFSTNLLGYIKYADDDQLWTLLRNIRRAGDVVTVEAAVDRALSTRLNRPFDESVWSRIYHGHSSLLNFKYNFICNQNSDHPWAFCMWLKSLQSLHWHAFPTCNILVMLCYIILVLWRIYFTAFWIRPFTVIF